MCVAQSNVCVAQSMFGSAVAQSNVCLAQSNLVMLLHRVM